MSTHTTADTLETILVPLRKLIAWDGNVRRTRPDQAIEALAASIQSVGLLQSLVIRKAKGKYQVVAGKRRLLALSQLAAARTLPADFPVPCRVLPKEADLTEVSLAENVQHETMHPADEFEAFRSLLENGHSSADVAARFGISEFIVQKRLALARVSPALIQRYRYGEMTLDLLQAFTISDDHRAQEQVWSQLERWNRQPPTIRHLLAEDDVPGSDKRVRFVGIAAYEAAGGTVKRDLFADDESGEGVYLCDVDLLHRSLQEKLASAAETLQAQGWKWVEIRPDTDYQYLGGFRRVPAEPKPLPAKQRAKLEALEKEHAKLSEDLDGNSEEGAEDDEMRARYAQLDELESRIEALREAQEQDYPDSVKASAGAILSVAHNGTLQTTYGLVRKQDEASFSNGRSTERDSDSQAGDSPDGEEKGCGYSAALVESLTAYKTAAIAAELTQNVPIALAAIVYTFAIQEFVLDLRLYGTGSCLQLAQTHPSLELAPDSSARAFFEQQRSAWLAQLPRNLAGLWVWCLQQPLERLLQFLAFLGAAAVNAMQTKHDTGDSGRVPHADALTAALAFDMSRWFQPTAENFFDRIPKAKILAALEEGGKEAGPLRQSLKKAELAKVAEHDLAQTGWLPQPLRLSPDFEQRLRGHVFDDVLDSELSDTPEGEGDE